MLKKYADNGESPKARAKKGVYEYNPKESIQRTKLNRSSEKKPPMKHAFQTPGSASKSTTPSTHKQSKSATKKTLEIAKNTISDDGVPYDLDNDPDKPENAINSSVVIEIIDINGHK